VVHATHATATLPTGDVLQVLVGLMLVLERARPEVGQEVKHLRDETLGYAA
jgi:hypothetical protein